MSLTAFLQKNKKYILDFSEYVFVSPHLDDAILSCANMLLKLKKRGKRVSVITVFTSATNISSTPQAKEFLDLCHYKDPIRLFRDRGKEDLKAIEFVGARSIHLGFIDAAWRQKRGKALYPNSKTQFSGKIAGEDNALINKIKKSLLTKLNSKGNTLVLCPLGVGGHVDHVITRKVVESIPMPKLFWEDYPYSTRERSLKTFLSRNKKLMRYLKLFQINHSKKDAAIRYYKSQIPSLFPSGKIPNFIETYYTPDGSKPF